MSVHAEAPWRVVDDEKEEARRIVACVNSCRDIPTDWLESNEIGPHVSMCSLNQLQAEQQRDNLLEALKLLLIGIEAEEKRNGTVFCGFSIDLARDAIKEVEADK